MSKGEHRKKRKEKCSKNNCVFTYGNILALICSWLTEYWKKKKIIFGI